MGVSLIASELFVSARDGSFGDKPRRLLTYIVYILVKSLVGLSPKILPAYAVIIARGNLLFLILKR